MKRSQTKRARMMRRMRRTETRNAKRLRLEIRRIGFYLYKMRYSYHLESSRRTLERELEYAKKCYSLLTRKERGLC